MTSSTILITGASGCVGQYISSWFLENSEAKLLLWLRDPKKLTAIPSNHPRVKVLIGDLRKPHIFSDELSKVTHLIHTATAWGDPERAKQVNVLAVKELLSLLNPKLLDQIIYFSTASILNKNLEPLPEALLYGTEYIQTKAQCLQELEKHPFSEKIVAVFPTLVFGGRVDKTSNFPTSYLTAGLLEASNWLWLARWLRAESSFHFIHAKDIAFICGHLATSPHKRALKGNRSLQKIVMGQPAISMNTALHKLCKWRGLKKTPGIPLWGWLIEMLIRVLPLEITPWDRFSIKQKHFIHDPITNPETIGGVSYAPTLEEILTTSGLKVRKQGRKR